MKKKEYISPDLKVIYLKAKHRLLQDSKKIYQSTKNLRSTDDEGMENGLEFD